MKSITKVCYFDGKINTTRMHNVKTGICERVINKITEYKRLIKEKKIFPTIKADRKKL